MAESLRRGADGPTRVTPSAGARARDVSRDVDAEKAGVRAWLETRDGEAVEAGAVDDDRRHDDVGRPESS